MYIFVSYRGKCYFRANVTLRCNTMFDHWKNGSSLLKSTISLELPYFRAHWPTTVVSLSISPLSKSHDGSKCICQSDSAERQHIESCENSILFCLSMKRNVCDLKTNNRKIYSKPYFRSDGCICVGQWEKCFRKKKTTSSICSGVCTFYS